MIKRLAFTIFCILSVVFPSGAQTNYIVAGVTTVNDTSTDLTPDTLMECLTVHLSPYPTEIDSFDLDCDEIYDVRFTTFGNGGLGGGTGGCTVNGLNGNVKIAIRKDTAYICCPQPVIVDVPMPFSAGDTIAENQNYSNSGWMMSTAYAASTNTTPIFYPWNNIGQHYIGVRMEYVFDTLYAWIAVAATGNTSSSSLYTLTIDQYSSNKNTHLSTPEIFLQQEVMIYPNPAQRSITARFPLSKAEVYIFTITNMLGEKVYETNSYFGENEKKIELPELSEGVYQFTATSHSKKFHQKLLITR
jgi:hypothetical protein